LVKTFGVAEINNCALSTTPWVGATDRKERGGFSAGHSGLGLLNRGEHAFTEIQALPLAHALAEGISKLAYLNGELA
jgi:hypothetical protein